MNKDASVLSYSHLDSQRLQQAFFSPPKKQVSPKKRSLFLPLLALLILTLVLFLFNYEFILIPRLYLAPSKNVASLLPKDNLSSVKFLGTNKELIQTKGSMTYLPIPNQEILGIKLDFEKPLNLKENQLFLSIKKSATPLIVKVIAKDNKFFSNIKTPVMISLDKRSISSFIEVPVYFQYKDSPNINFSKISQIKIYFQKAAEKNEPATMANNISFRERNWVLIKDIAVVKKGDK